MGRGHQICPGVLLTGGLCGLRSTTRRGEMQEHMPEDDLTNPEEFAPPLSGILWEHHHVGISRGPRRSCNICNPLLTASSWASCQRPWQVPPCSRPTSYLTDLMISAQQQR